MQEISSNRSSGLNEVQECVRGVGVSVAVSRWNDVEEGERGSQTQKNCLQNMNLCLLNNFREAHRLVRHKALREQLSDLMPSGLYLFIAFLRTLNQKVRRKKWAEVVSTKNRITKKPAGFEIIAKNFNWKQFKTQMKKRKTKTIAHNYKKRKRVNNADKNNPFLIKYGNKRWWTIILSLLTNRIYSFYFFYSYRIMEFHILTTVSIRRNPVVQNLLFQKDIKTFEIIALKFVRKTTKQHSWQIASKWPQ